jgi:hypothetical protein
MGSLHFFCPTYQQSFEPGFDVDDDTFRRHRLKIAHMTCPWCERTHRFLLADGRRAFAAEEIATELVQKPVPTMWQEDLGLGLR